MIQAYTDFQRDAINLTRQEFLAQHAHSVLVIEPFANEESAVYMTRAASPERGHGRSVAVLTKRAGSNDFKMMVTIGRAKNNDVQIPCDDVSKFHAYVLHKPSEDKFQFADAGSTFGTEIDGERVKARVPHTLRSGMRIQFGSVDAVYYAPADFLAHLLESGK